MDTGFTGSQQKHHPGEVGEDDGTVKNGEIVRKKVDTSHQTRVVVVGGHAPLDPSIDGKKQRDAHDEPYDSLHSIRQSGHFEEFRSGIRDHSDQQTQCVAENRHKKEVDGEHDQGGFQSIGAHGLEFWSKRDCPVKRKGSECVKFGDLGTR